MEQIINILKNRIDYFKKGDYKSIYNLYAAGSEFLQFFEDIESYKDHFQKLKKVVEPVSIEIYTIREENEKVVVLFSETVKNLDNDELLYYYGKSELVNVSGLWQILSEKREVKK